MKIWPKLFSRATTGNLLEWWIEQDGEKYRTVSGTIEGGKVVSSWTVAISKNVGKTNETSPEEQATLEIEAKYTKQLKSGYSKSIEEVDKNSFFQPMLAHKYEDYQDEIDWERGVLISPKLDGLRCIITKNGMFSRNGNPILSCPHIFEAIKPIFKDHPEYIFDGEIYCHKLKHNFNKIISLARKTKPTQEDFDEAALLS